MAMAIMPHMKRWLDLRMSCLIIAYVLYKVMMMSMVGCGSGLGRGT